MKDTNLLLKNRRLNRRLSHRLTFTLGELFDIFSEEAERICDSETEAEMLTTEALQDFINRYSANTIILQ